MINKRSTPLNITIYGQHSDDFIRHQNILNEHGYNLEASSDLEQFFVHADSADISIISSTASPEVLGRFEELGLSEHAAPFLVYDFSAKCDFGENFALAHRAVGHFVHRPSPEDISLKVEVGLLLHKERRAISQRLLDLNQKFEANRDIGVATGIVVSAGDLSVQEAYELLRLIARGQRCRVSDIARALVQKQVSGNKLKGLEAIRTWLETTVIMHHDRS